MDKKQNYLYMRLTQNQKQDIQCLANAMDMTMSQYIWYLITKDKERRVKN